MRYFIASSKPGKFLLGLTLGGKLKHVELAPCSKWGLPPRIVTDAGIACLLLTQITDETFHLSPAP